jgi:UDP-3-O-[3-hydroxymyristoyl] N-acetylglucosamine deacetylase
LESAVSFDGVGAHGGTFCRALVSPASEDSGITFLVGNDEISADFRNAFETMSCSKLSSPRGASVSTIEHLVAALYGVGITNAAVEVEGGEIPILDGSSLPFVEAFLSAGLKKQTKKLRILKVLKTVKIHDDEKWSSLSPANSFSINVECNYSAKGLKTRPVSFDFSKEDFIKQIAPARTFGFFSDVEFLRKNNLALGSSLENSVVFDENGQPLNDGGLRFDDEPIRHKILDIIGDLSLAGCEIKARFDAFYPTHATNNRILRALFENDDNYEIIR